MADEKSERMDKPVTGKVVTPSGKPVSTVVAALPEWARPLGLRLDTALTKAGIRRIEAEKDLMDATSQWAYAKQGAASALQELERFNERANDGSLDATIKKQFEVEDMEAEIALLDSEARLAKARRKAHKEKQKTERTLSGDDEETGEASVSAQEPEPDQMKIFEEEMGGLLNTGVKGKYGQAASAIIGKWLKEQGIESVDELSKEQRDLVERVRLEAIRSSENEDH